MAHKILLRADGLWPKAIHLYMWTYALQMAVRVYNNVPNDADSISRLDTFAWIAVSHKSIHYHTFGCTALALTTEAGQGKYKKWGGFLVPAIYLGPYPHHSGSSSLVLSLSTGNSSPQFRVGHDNFFDTTRFNRCNT